MSILISKIFFVANCSFYYRQLDAQICNVCSYAVYQRFHHIVNQNESIRKHSSFFSYGLDSTMNLDALRVQHYKEVRGRKEKYGSKVNSYCDCSKLAKIGTSGQRLQ